VLSNPAPGSSGPDVTQDPDLGANTSLLEESPVENNAFLEFFRKFRHCAGYLNINAGGCDFFSSI